MEAKKISYKIYPLPGICDKTLTGSIDAGGVCTVGDLLRAISGRDDVDFSAACATPGWDGDDFAAGVPLLALLDGKPLDLSDGDRVVGDCSELLILPAIMGG